MKIYVITGGPCCGKTTTIKGLERESFSILEESARKIINRHKPLNRDLLQKMIFKMQQRDLEIYKNSGRKIFADRGFGDTLAYYLFDDLKIPLELIEKSKQYKYEKIFLLESLNFYETEGVRNESIADRDKIERYIIKSYNLLGYNIIKVPFMSVNSRINFIKKHI